MADVFTQEKRSQVMSRIRSRGNKDTELALSSLFRRHGISRWRRHQQLSVRSRRDQSAPASKRTSLWRDGADSRLRLRVRPDFVFPKLRLAVFVDGCFWHACPLHATKPRHNAAFWRKKLAANKARDRMVNRTLRAQGWRVLRIWEHELPKHGVRSAERGEGRLLAKLRKALAA
jgi:DNA mismatch endonuclease (patch repair protein)